MTTEVRDISRVITNLESLGLRCLVDNTDPFSSLFDVLIEVIK